MPDPQTSSPIQPIPTIAQPQTGLSSAAIAELRRYIEGLQQKQSRTPTFTKGAIGMGLEDLSRQITGGLLTRQADEMERQRLRTAAAGDLPENPYSATGNSAAVGGLFGLNSAAPGGAGAASPFTTPATSQADGTGAEGATTPDLTAFIKEREGFRANPYPDGKQTSIGYGTRARPGETQIGREDGEQRLNEEVGNAAKAVDSFAPNLPPQARNALIDLTYNTGTKWQNSGLGQAVRAGDWQTAKELFTQYNHANGAVSPGLTARREALAPVFTSPNGAMLFQDLSRLGATPALPFTGEPTSPNPLASPPAGARLAQATTPAQAPQGLPAATATPPQPNLLAPQVAPQNKPYIPWASIPRPAPVSREAAMNAYAAAETDAQRKMISDRYMQQFQPVVIPWGNGYISANFANSTQTFFSQPKDTNYKLGGNEVPARIYTDPITGRDRPELIVPGEQGQRAATTPQTPAPALRQAPPRFAPTDAELYGGATTPAAPVPPPAKVGTPQYQKQLNTFIDQTPDTFPDPNEAFKGGLRGIEKHNAAVKAYEESAKPFQEMRDRIANEAHSARDDYDQLKLLERILPYVKSGAGGTTIAALNDAARQAGLSSGELATWRQVAEKLGSRQQVADVRNTTIGQGTAVRMAEADAIKNSQFSLEKTPAANLAVTRLQLRALERLEELSDFTDGYVQKHGRLDQGYLTARNQWFAKPENRFMSIEELEKHKDLIKAGTKQDGGMGVTPAPDQPGPTFGTPMSRVPVTSASPSSASPAASPPQAPVPGQPGSMPPSLSEIMQKGLPGPDITARARGALGLPAQVPPAGPASTYTRDVTSRAREHPEGVLIPLGAAGAQGASVGIRSFLVRNPSQCGHRFRRKAATQSDRKRPPIPNEAGHPVDGVKQGTLSAV